MSTPLSPQEIHSKIANAHEGQAITFKVRKPGTLILCYLEDKK